MSVGTMKKVAIIGSGSWGTTMAVVLAENIVKLNDFHIDINMWVFEEQINGRNLTDYINKDRCNIKYLPKVKLPRNLVAVSDLSKCVSDATHLVFVVPHQFIEKTVSSIKPFIGKNVAGISLIKGILEDHHEPNFITEIITKELNIHMSVLAGANIASEIGDKQFSETTIGCTDEQLGKDWKNIFHGSYFKVNVIPYTLPVEITSALKNIVALAAGFSDALNKGCNTKASLIRMGMLEIINFCKLYTKVDNNDIYMESFGIADLIATCYGGRNRLVAEQFIKTGKDLDLLEKELLNGQKLQGPSTSQHIYSILKAKGIENKYPIFVGVYKVIYEREHVETLFDLLKKL